MIGQILFFLGVSLVVRGDPKNPIYGPFEDFRTEPSFQAHRFNVSITTPDAALLSPGYYFVSIFTFFAESFGPHIVDEDGQLVWFGNDSTAGKAHEVYACDYRGAVLGSHLCLVQGNNVGTEIRGVQAVVLDNTYSQASPNFTWTKQNPDILPGEGHEFNVLSGGMSYLTANRGFKELDLSAYGGPVDGLVRDACWQHIDIPSYRERGPIFSWCALDHLEIEDTEVWLNLPTTKVSGNYTDEVGGLGNRAHPWDLFHQNSIDDDHAGNYLVSLRHADQIILVAGPKTKNTYYKPGDVIWRLGGFRHNDFTMVGDWSFSRQHHIRYVSSNATSMTVSLFDNAWTVRTEEGFAGHVSRGLIVSLDTSTMTAHLLHEYSHPWGTTTNVSVAAGSTQVLPNGNVIVGWGSNPELSEYSQSGQILWHARFASMEGVDMRSYRAYKFPWVGKPRHPPKIIAYQASCHESNAPLIAWVSWNGATEVVHWRFWIRFGFPWIWIYAGQDVRRGFETQVDLENLQGKSWKMGYISRTLQPHWQSVYVEAIDSDGHVLGSTSKTTFVPKSDLEHRCAHDGCGCAVVADGHDGCTENGKFLYAPEWSQQCHSRKASLVVGFLTFTIATGLVFFALWPLRLIIQRSHRAVFPNVTGSNKTGTPSWKILVRKLGLFDSLTLAFARRNQAYASLPLEYINQEHSEERCALISQNPSDQVVSTG